MASHGQWGPVWLGLSSAKPRHMTMGATPRGVAILPADATASTTAAVVQTAFAEATATCFDTSAADVCAGFAAAAAAAVAANVAVFDIITATPPAALLVGFASAVATAALTYWATEPLRYQMQCPSYLDATPSKAPRMKETPVCLRTYAWSPFVSATFDLAYE